MLRILFLALLVVSAGDAVRAADLRAVCVASGDDDTLRGYDPTLRAASARAFLRLFPGVHEAPPESLLAAQGRFRCMGGRVYACFVGANLPCDKLAIALDNPGADSFCRDHHEADVVPIFATGHDAVYAYRCQDGRAIRQRRIWQLDARGFARELWTPLD